MSATDELYLHVVRRQTYLELIALELYGSLDSAMAKDFLHYNQLAAGEFNEVLEGQLLYLPGPFCYEASIETGIINMVGQINQQIREGMDASQRRVIAENPQLVNSAADDPNVLIDGAAAGTTMAGYLISFSSEANKMVGESLKELEQAYVDSFKKHRKLTPHFFEKRRQIYTRLDSAMGRYGRTLALGSPLTRDAKKVLRISSKSQVIQWKRQGGAQNVGAFQTHFDRFNRASRYLKGGGYLTAGLGVYVNELDIQAACKADSSTCEFSKYSLRGKTAGGLAGATGGGFVASYGTCNLVFGLPSAGSSMLWCAIVAGAAGSTAGGYLGSKLGQSGGELLYERTVR